MLGWFKRRRKVHQESASPTDSVNCTERPAVNDKPKYPKPKIILVDMPNLCFDILTKAGYAVKKGSFGAPRHVKQSDGYAAISTQSASLPNCIEQEIWIVNITCPSTTEEEPEPPGDGVEAFWQQCTTGEIDPRPFVMTSIVNDVDTTLRHGGLVIVLIDAKYHIEYIHGAGHGGRGIQTQSRPRMSSWGFLYELDAIDSYDAHGYEIKWETNLELSKLLQRAGNDAYFSCTLRPGYKVKDSWHTLANNKFGEAVAGTVVGSDGNPLLLVLPQMPSIHNILIELIERWCAEWRPELFPFHEGANWVHRPEYEIPGILELQQHMSKVENDAQKRLAELKQEIEDLRNKNKDWYTLLNGTGDELVAAVIRSLTELGFKDVVDVDREIKTGGDSALLREDIQVLDADPALIIDVKGVSGHPEDAEATQAEKHALMRSREFEGKVKPLTIINHQRNIPPHDRDQQAYRAEIIDNAKQTGLGLMTTWDLFKLLRNVSRLNWQSKDVLPIFYRSGRIEPIPEHYNHVGEVVKVWEHSFGVIPSETIKVGDHIGIDAGDTFEELEVKSIQVDGQSCGMAEAGSKCGILCDGASNQFKEGMRVFAIESGGGS